MELELKLALPGQNPQLLEKQLARVPLIGRRKPKRQQLHSTYYDTPEHALQQAAVALRVRRIGDANHPHWVQTLKIGGRSDSAFSQRGEWEVALSGDTLDRGMLANTPWTERDPDGAWFEALAPVFTTTFERLSWVVQVGDASAEVALDRGSVQMDGHSTPLCELEIELLSGTPVALFEIAEQIGLQVALLPLHMSKAERAYRLAQGTLEAPLRARPPALSKGMAFSQVVQTVLRETFLQFSANLNTLRSSDSPEVLHQARVGWRRFKSALKLFRQLNDTGSFPALTALKPLLLQMTQLRDLDVVASEVLPAHAEAYQAGDTKRAKQWQQLEEALAQARLQQREAVRAILADPAVGRTLLQITRWIDTGAIQPPHSRHKHKTPHTRKWLLTRIEKLVAQVQSIPAHSGDPVDQHRLRILSKRLRYCVECLRPLLPGKRAERWLQVAIQSQTQIGMERDRLLAIDTAQRMHAADGVVQFLRGAAFAANAAPHWYSPLLITHD